MGDLVVAMPTTAEMVDASTTEITDATTIEMTDDTTTEMADASMTEMADATTRETVVDMMITANGGETMDTTLAGHVVEDNFQQLRRKSKTTQILKFS